jgi:helicase required for RNAi-mediated heterochromatin assembly 1
MASTLSKGQEAGALKILKCHFKKEYEDQEFEEAWRNLPEVPTQGEVMPACNDHNSDKTRSEPWDRYQQEHAIYEPNPNLPHNIVDGPWPSKEAFVGAQYQILREDAIAGLRRSVADIKATPNMQDSKDTCIYDHVRSPLFVQEFELTSHQVSFKGILLSSLGAAFRVEFSTERAGKQIRWGQSKRLVAGTIVALTPQRDMFRSICKIAVVAARPILGGLDQNPPLIDLFWSDPNDAVVDPVGHYVMVESRTGYYEASRHMLVAMQKLMTEKYVFSHSMNPWLSEIHLDIDYQCWDQPGTIF